MTVGIDERQNERNNKHKGEESRDMSSSIILDLNLLE
jgi:hypothetical protein